MIWLNTEYSLIHPMMVLALLHGPNLLRLLLVRINVHHPVEDNGMKFASGVVASFLGRNRTFQPKARMLCEH